jgi:hypothetical protein
MFDLTHFLSPSESTLKCPYCDSLIVKDHFSRTNRVICSCGLLSAEISLVFDMEDSTVINNIFCSLRTKHDIPKSKGKLNILSSVNVHGLSNSEIRNDDGLYTDSIIKYDKLFRKFYTGKVLDILDMHATLDNIINTLPFL